MNATRARAIQVYHSKQWAMLRKFVPDPDPICKACGERLSSQVDHILPMSEGGTEYNPAGLQESVHQWIGGYPIGSSSGSPGIYQDNLWGLLVALSSGPR